MRSYTDITQNYLSELEKRKALCQEELSEIDIAITNCKNLVDGNIITTAPVVKTKIRKKPKKITEKMIRDAIIHISKNPVDRRNRFPVDEGFFTQSHINDYLEITHHNVVTKRILDKFVDKKILESKSYKRGTQYRYIPHTEISRAIDTQISTEPKLAEDSNRYANGEPVPGTGKQSLHARDKDVEKMLRSAESQGYKVERLGSDHLRVRNGSGKGATISTTASSSRLVPNVKADLRRIGVNV